MPQPNDLSRSLVALDQNSTIIAVVELSQSSWLVAWSVSTTLIQPGSEFRLRVLVSLSVASGRPASNEEVQPVDLWTTQAR
jgi:hypothetical protein